MHDTTKPKKHINLFIDVLKCELSNTYPCILWCFGTVAASNISKKSKIIRIFMPMER